jgi:hypothetical protein
LIKHDLLAGDFRFSLPSQVLLANGEEFDLWSARYTVVLKA